MTILRCARSENTCAPLRLKATDGEQDRSFLRVLIASLRAAIPLNNLTSFFNVLDKFIDKRWN